ncbi:hypothetical protein AB6D67_23190 [Vibrio splendidus]
MNKNAMKATNLILWGCIVLLNTFAFSSSVLIAFSEKNLVWDFTSNGFSFFLELYSFPVKLISAALAVFSIWAVAYNIYRTRLAFVQGQLVNELCRCEDELKNILSQKMTPQEVIVMLQNKLAQRSNLDYICGYFNQCANAELSIDELVPHFTKLGISEADGVYRTMTQNLTLRLTRYSLALLELSEMSEDRMFVKYYANKYIPLMIDLYHYKAEMDINLVHICFQLSSVQAKFDFDFSKINGSDHVEIANKFQQLLKTQKI